MMYCETHKDGTIVSNKPECMRAAMYQGTLNRCVITEWVEKEVYVSLLDVNQAQTERYNDLLMRIEGLLEDVAE